MSTEPEQRRPFPPFKALMIVYALAAFAGCVIILVHVAKRARALYTPPSGQLAAVLLGHGTNVMSGAAQDLERDPSGE